MTDLPDVKLKMVVTFPAQAIGDAGIAVTKQNGNYHFALDYTDFGPPVAPLPDLPNQAVLAWNISTGVFALTPLSALGGPGSSGIPEAPTDGQLYGRKSSAWSAIIPPGAGVISIDGATGAFTLDTSLQNITNQLSVKTVDLSGSLSSVVYKQVEASAVSSPLIRRLQNTLFASEFGAVGNGVTNDAPALQAFLNALGTSKKEGRLDPGKSYFLSGADLTLAVGAGTGVSDTGSWNTALYGFGARLLTDAAGSQYRIALRVVNVAPGNRRDQSRRVLIDGIHVDQYQLPTQLYGMALYGNAHVTVRGCSFISGSDNATPNYAGHAQIYLAQRNTADENTGNFWTRIEDCVFEGGATATPTPFCILCEGGNNATDIVRCTFSNADKAIAVARAQVGADDHSATLANGLRVSNCDFEAVNYGIYASGTSGHSALEGLICHSNRIESMGNMFFSYILDKEPYSAPVIGPNYVSSGDWGKYITNPNGLKIDCRDEIMGKATINPASLAAGATAIIGTITTFPASVTDVVAVEVAGDLLGCNVKGYVSSANTITLRLTNPTLAAVDLPSLNFTARVRRIF